MPSDWSGRYAHAMAYDLFIGDRTFSSWSMRGWLMLKTFDLPHHVHMVGLYSGTMADDLAALAPARLVPTMRLPDGTVVGESLAMAETLAERHPEASMWPSDPAARATARWLASEICAGFSALRSSCPMQLHSVWQGFDASEEVQTDLARLDALWQHARTFATEGPWLFGDWSLADVFYAPVAARIVGYDLPVTPFVRAYADAIIRHPAFCEWRDEGLKVTYDPMPYSMPLARSDWPETASQ